MQNEQETPAEMTPRRHCRNCCRPTTSTVLGLCASCAENPFSRSRAPYLLDGKPAGTCEMCRTVTANAVEMWGNRGWMCEKCAEPAVPASGFYPSMPSSSGSDIRIITSASSGTPSIPTAPDRTHTIANSAHLTCTRCGAKTTSLVNGVCRWCPAPFDGYRPSRYKGPDGIYRCPECGCHEGEVHTGPCLERRLEEKAKQGIYAALADLRAHGADMRVRISRLRWLPKYAAKGDSAPTKVRTRVTFRDFIRQIVSAVLAAI